MTYVNQFFFGIYPYFALAVFLLGSLVRFDREQYTWRSESTQVLHTGNLRLGSTLFHIGIIGLLGGHAVGLLTPVWVWDTLGVTHGEGVLRAVPLQEADRLGVTGADDDARIEALLTREVRVPRADEAACLTYYRNHPERFTRGEMVEARFGLHIVQVLRRIDGSLLPFDTLKSQISAWLATAALQRCVHQYLRILVGRARIEGITLEGSATPLVQ